MTALANEVEQSGITGAPDHQKLMMATDDVSFATLAFIRTYGRPDTNPVLIRENGRYLLEQVKEITPLLEQLVKAYEGF